MCELARKHVGDGRWVIVSAGKLSKALPADVIRVGEYRCVDKECDVPVTPALPEKEKEGRRKSPSPYFRAGSSRPHVEGCRRFGFVEEFHDDRANIVNPAHGLNFGDEHPEQGDAPERFLEKARTQRTPSEQQPRAKANNPRTVDREQNGAPGGHQHRQSQASSYVLRKFVENYETPPRALADMPIRIRGCPARTYAQTFLDPLLALGSRDGGRVRHIYRGEYLSHTEWQSGISIYFSGLYRGLKVAVWMPNALGPTSLLEEHRHRLASAGKLGGVVNVVGRFVETHNKYAIEIDSLQQLWISFPSHPVT